MLRESSRDLQRIMLPPEELDFGIRESHSDDQKQLIFLGVLTLCPNDAVAIRLRF